MERTKRRHVSTVCAFCEKARIWAAVGADGYGYWQDDKGRRHFDNCQAWQNAVGPDAYDFKQDEQPINAPYRP